MGLRNVALAGAGALTLAAPGAMAQQADPLPEDRAAERTADRPAIGPHLFVSTDSDDTTIVRAGIDLDLRHDGDARRLGIRVENAWYTLFDGDTRERQRVFLQAGDRSGDWTWAARIGTDGDSVIGVASVHDDARWRKEFFVERDIVETPIGVDEGIYSTFLGGALDIPLGEATTLTTLAGVQEFTGENVRLHARATLTQVIAADAGLSAQLRTRYFHSTSPQEFDYYSPEHFAQVLPALQLRRFIDGWRFRAIGGVGVQRDSFTDWNLATYAQAGVTAPSDGDWYLDADVIYTNTPGGNAAVADGYSYFQAMLSARRRF